ncbi:SCO family protein [Noviherbaspirillum sp.]|uniref:SCO family protein n=1 Tax=Noviherbaspirillum sp. TaxID=1926288 RepID=UPI002B468A31|nr:SCO family protein [Noviherbaspirillum sp.]HJV79460.1 SCO family protein [Noviherbaspirillum sp.]
MHGLAKHFHAWPTPLLQVPLLCLCLQSSLAQPVAAPPPQMQYEQRLDAQLPLSDAFTDDSGRIVKLGMFFNKEPVVLILGYYHCPNLCSTLMDGVMETLSEVGLPRHAYRVLGVSIDPTEDAALAARKKASYAGLVARAGGDLHLLTGSKPAIDTLASSAGFHYAYDRSMQQYVHPAGFLIATPDGRIAHYFMGVRFDPHDVRLALIDASSGRIGSPVDQLLLLCSHYAPVNGRYSAAVMTMVRLGSLAVLAALGIWIWRKRRRAA